VLVLVGIIIFAVPTFVTARKGLMSSQFLFHLYLLCGICVPYTLVYFDLLPSTSTIYNLHDEFAAQTYIIMCIANAICFVGASVVFEVNAEPKRFVFPQDSNTAIRLAKWSCLIAAIYFGVILVSFGGLHAVFTATFRRAKTENSAANVASIFYWGAYVTAVAAYHFKVVRSKRAPRGKLDRSEAIWVYLCVAFTTFLSFASGARSNMILFLLALLCKHLIRVRVHVQAVRLGTLGAFAGIISVVMLRLRYLFQAVHGTSQRSGESALTTAVTGVTFIDHIAQSMLYAKQNGFDYGMLYVRMPLAFIPRGLWPDKPIQLGMLLRGFVFGDETGGIPPGLFGEAYIAFGVVGILMMATIWAFVLNKCDKLLSFARKSASAYHSMLVAVLAPNVAFIMVRGGTDVGIYRVTFPLLWCWLVYSGLKKRKKIEHDRIRHARLSAVMH